MGLTEAEVAERSGSSVERVQELTRLGILVPRDDDRPFGATDVHRVRLLQAFEDAGIQAEVIARGIAAGSDLWPEAERECLERSGIQVVKWRDGKPSGDLVAPLEQLARRVQEIYLHIDFDGFAPEVAPGIVDEPVPGGLSFEDAEGIMRAAAERFRIRAATLATYTPELDKEERTLRVGLRIIELLGELTQQSR
jgi:arginase family enzyme